MRLNGRLVQLFLIAGFLFATGVVLSVRHSTTRAAETKKPQTAARTVYGIKQRIPWTTSRITGSLEPPHPYKIERVFPKLQFTNPVTMTTAPGSDRLFVVELDGKVYSFSGDGSAEKPDLFLDLKKLSKDARRIYGMTFHPDFAANRYVYLCYIGKEGDANGTRVSQFEVSKTNPPVVDLATETTVIEWYCGGHNGGCLKFGPRDGFLYISTGDSSSPSPPDSKSTGQDNSDLLASILRIDVNHADAPNAYGVPADNPFVDTVGSRPEIWAYGFRNPWRMNFDAETGWLWLGDVGWEMWEMVHRVERGGNYGWSVLEGPQSVRTEITPGPTPILPPVASHSHIESRSITGGAVYRGKRLKGLHGAYIYGDYVTGKIWGLRYDGKKLTWQQELVDSSLAVVTFGEDQNGELYVLDYAGGIYRLTENNAAQANSEFPQKLSETGLFASVKDHKPAAGVIPYSVNAAPWADGATAERLIAVPRSPKLEVWTTSNAQKGNLRGNWKYPADTVFAKTLSLETEPGKPDSSRRIETQILHYDVDTWRAYTYVWNDDQTDAVLAPAAGVDKTLMIRDPSAPNQRRQQTWHVAGRTECIVCHTTRGGSVYGFVPPQLNKRHEYGDVVADQLATLIHIGLFDDPSTAEPKNAEHQIGALPDPFDDKLDLDKRARAYLHVNCAQCHRRGGGGTAKFELLYHFKLDKMALLGERPSQGSFKLHAAENVAPGDPYRSLIYYRLAKLGSGHMPKIGSNVIDREGLRLIHDWIAQMVWAEDEDGQYEPTPKLRSIQKQAMANLTTAGDAAALDQLLSTTSGALMLLSAVDADRFAPAVNRQIVAKATAHPAEEVRGLFERFLPEEKRVKRLGNVVKSEEILALDGDAARGKAVFFQAAGVQCKSCHQIGDEGKQVGPELNKIGKKYNRVQLLETILEPSKKIEKEWVVYIVETTAGRIHTGLLVKRTDAEIILKDSEGKQIHIPANEVELIVPQRKSLMPELLLREMTGQQVADLLAYLSGLK
jgi:uncharacterized repeat protein (TIGR03806 family)